MFVQAKAGWTDQVTIRPQLIDLTLMFGDGNEPTLEEWEALNIPYIPYNEGEVVHSLNNITSCAENLWDGELQTGYLDMSGNLVEEEGCAVSKFIPILPGYDYYFNGADSKFGEPIAFFYDINKDFTGYTALSAKSDSFVADANEYYVRIMFTQAEKYDAPRTLSAVTDAPEKECINHETTIGYELGAYDYIDNVSGQIVRHTKKISCKDIAFNYYASGDNWFRCSLDNFSDIDWSQPFFMDDYAYTPNSREI